MDDANRGCTLVLVPESNVHDVKERITSKLGVTPDCVRLEVEMKPYGMFVTLDEETMQYVEDGSKLRLINISKYVSGLV